jgi:hypothetical protein
VAKITAQLLVVDDYEDSLCLTGKHNFSLLTDLTSSGMLKSIVFCTHCGCLVTYEAHESKESTS